ncbi:MAG: hypothetical protein HYY93_08605 [Planctomycetes bacterium]|nr:hypothetical protein [Planctomycetota bacterium]
MGSHAPSTFCPHFPPDALALLAGSHELSSAMASMDVMKKRKLVPPTAALSMIILLDSKIALASAAHGALARLQGGQCRMDG